VFRHPAKNEIGVRILRGHDPSKLRKQERFRGSKGPAIAKSVSLSSKQAKRMGTGVWVLADRDTQTEVLRETAVEALWGVGRRYARMLRQNGIETALDLREAVSFSFTPGTIRVLDPATIPTVSEWGMIVMSLLLVAAGCVVFAKRGGAIGLAGGGCSPEDGGDAPPEM